MPDLGPDADRDLGAVRPEDDLAAFRSPLQRLGSAGRRWLAAVVAAALLVPAATFLADELSFRRSADAVVATLAGERVGAAAADTVLLVRAVGCDGRSSSGTAFVVATGDGPVLVTNRHVVDDSLRVGVRALDGSTTLRVTEVRSSAAADVAVLAVDRPDALPPPLQLAGRRIEVGAAVRLVGFPAATPFTDAGEVVSAGDPLSLDLAVAPGASGSPVVAEDGQVVGQVYAVDADGRGVATPADRLQRAIEDVRPAPGCRPTP